MKELPNGCNELLNEAGKLLTKGALPSTENLDQINNLVNQATVLKLLNELECLLNTDQPFTTDTLRSVDMIMSDVNCRVS